MSLNSYNTATGASSVRYDDELPSPRLLIFFNNTSQVMCQPLSYPMATRCRGDLAWCVITLASHPGFSPVWMKWDYSFREIAIILFRGNNNITCIALYHLCTVTTPNGMLHNNQSTCTYMSWGWGVQWLLVVVYLRRGRHVHISPTGDNLALMS